MGARLVDSCSKPHAHTDISVDGVGALDSGLRVLHEAQLAVVVLGDVAGDGDDFYVGRVAAGCGHGYIGAQLRACEHERVADIVAVADKGEVDAGDGAEVLFDGHEVGQGLAGMLEVGEGVDDGDARG